MNRVAVAAGIVTILVLGSLAQLAPRTVSAPTFAKDIAPIIYAKCLVCHRPGQIAGFSLLTFDDVRKRILEIKRAVSNGSMPPWKPVAGFGEFRDSRSLSAEETSLFQRWLAAGALEGDPADLPTLPRFEDGWQLGKPDLVVKMPVPFEVRVVGSDVFQCFVIPIPVTNDEFVSGFEFHPGNPKILHHSILFLDSSGVARGKITASSGSGYSCFGGPGFSPTGALGGWSPGSVPTLFRADVGKLIRKGSDLVMQNHYHAGSASERDQSEIGIYFAKAPPKYRSISIPVLQYDLDIPPGEESYRIQTFFDTPIELQVLGITPHMHYLGREMKVHASLPDGSVQPLIWIRDWDVKWQGEYYYKQPLLLPKGTRISLEATYDNSALNPNNPSSPPKRVRWGEESTDEMALCLIETAVEKQEDLRLLRQAVLGQPGIGSKGGDR
jgi:hypothetical protein